MRKREARHCGLWSAGLYKLYELFDLSESMLPLLSAVLPDQDTNLGLYKNLVPIGITVKSRRCEPLSCLMFLCLLASGRVASAALYL